ncbi:MAG: endonuclease domain-containing protein [Deltaproteobacteria bacterium]|nr:endonuclease domain-containing protein [Deltaproteobacteria bacterium]
MKFMYNDPSLKSTRRKLRNNQTNVERLLWNHLKNKQFYGLKFYRQYSIGEYILDFYSPELKLAIELDGGQHAEENNKSQDQIRADYLKSQGIKVMRFWNNDVIQNIGGILDKIKEDCNSPAPS